MIRSSNALVFRMVQFYFPSKNLEKLGEKILTESNLTRRLGHNVKKVIIEIWLNCRVLKYIELYSLSINLRLPRNITNFVYQDDGEDVLLILI